MSGFMHGFLERLPKIILTSLIIILLSLLFAYFSATKAEQQFGEYFNPAMLKSIEETIPQNSDSELESIFKAYGQSSSQLPGRSALDSYNNLIEQYTKLTNLVTSFGEKGIFWITFLFSFLFAFIFLNKIYHILKNLIHGADPAVEDNIKALAEVTNQLIDQQNSSTPQVSTLQ